MKNLIFLLILPLFLNSCKYNSQESKTEDPLPTAAEVKLNSAEKHRFTDLLKVKTPQENQSFSSPTTLEGEARGYWFFEADAPVELVNENFEPMAKSYISAQGEWMTDDWVPFEGTLEFPTPSTQKGYLIFHRANPSGLEENAMSDTLEVSFKI